MAVDALLSRLESVKSTGRESWLARCPAHQDRSPSLTVRELPDGRILVHCFAGCGAADVVGAIGLSFTDLFPQRLGQFQPIREPFTANDALRALKREVGVIALAAAHVSEGKPVSLEQRQRIDVAMARIADAAEYVSAA
jgi:hypothetical protein